MEPKIVCGINMFSQNQDILYCSDEGVKQIGSFPLDHVAETIMALASSKDCHLVDLSGNEKFAEMILNDINEYKQKHYNNQLEMRICINGKVFD